MAQWLAAFAACRLQRTTHLNIFHKFNKPAKRHLQQEEASEHNFERLKQYIVEKHADGMHRCM